MTKTFVARYEDFSLYRSSKEGLIAYTHDEVLTRYEADFHDLASLFQMLDLTRDQFVAFAANVLGSGDDADDIRWCARCDDLEHLEDGSTPRNGNWTCDSCISGYYTTCSWCEEYDDDHNMTSTLYDDSVCPDCRAAHYSYCDDCDGYARDDTFNEYHSHEEESEGNGCCQSPLAAQRFLMRNDGDPLLANDTRATITLPAGLIDDEGMGRIWQYVRDYVGYGAASVVMGVGNTVQTKDGNFTKRLSRAIYKATGDKIAPSVLSQIGNIASDHSRAVNFEIETTRDLNQSASAFYHEDSCWWQSYFTGRCALKTNGGIGLRTFDTDGFGSGVSGRAWIMPLKITGETVTPAVPGTPERTVTPGCGCCEPVVYPAVEGTPAITKPVLEPTFETLDADAFVVFNGYGALEGYNAARIVSHMAGFTYRKINFTCSLGSHVTAMYVNGDTGYLVAPEEIAQHFTDGYLRLSADQHSDLYEDERAASTNPGADKRELISA